MIKISLTKNVIKNLQIGTNITQKCKKINFLDKNDEMTKPLLSKGFNEFFGDFLVGCFCHLLSDTKLTKNKIQFILARYLSRNISQMKQTTTNLY